MARLADVADFRLGKMLDGRKNKGYPRHYLANVNVRWGRFDLDDLREMRFEEHELEKYGLRDGDIVMCEGGVPGRCALWKEQLPGMTLQKALHRIRPGACMSNQFLYYNLFHRGRAGRFAPLFTGATIKHLPRQQLAKVEVDVPPMAVQKCIADILSAYDDLIENNRRRIALLEQTARELYREWFVRLRFPGHESTRIIGGVPERWERKTLGEVANITMGQSPKSTHYNETGDGLPFHQGVAHFGDRFPAHRMYCSLEARVAVPGDILFSVRAPVGRINLTHDKIVIGRGIAAIQSVQDQQSFLFLCLEEPLFQGRHDRRRHHIRIRDKKRPSWRSNHAGYLQRSPDVHGPHSVRGFADQRTAPNGSTTDVRARPSPPTRHVWGGGDMKRADADVIPVGEGSRLNSCTRETSGIGWEMCAFANVTGGMTLPKIGDSDVGVERKPPKCFTGK